jgi:tetratricopeptide (TPR) repeat protein
LGNLKDGYASIQSATEIYQASGQDYNNSIPEQIVKQTNLIFNDMALKLAGEGNYEKALALFNKIIHSENNLCNGFDDIDYRFHLNRGDCFRALHKLNQALSDYSLALSLHPNDWDIKTRLSITHYLTATDFYNASDYYEAEIELSEAIEYNPKVYEYYIARGKCRYYLGMFHEAYNDYKVALTFNPTNEDLINRIKQFESDDQNLLKNDNEKKKSVKIDTDTGTKRIDVDKKDMIQMMLEPNKAKKLPYVRLLHDSNASRPIVLGPKAETYLPKISPHMAISLIANHDVSNQVQKLHKLLDTRPSNKKDAIWSMFDEVRASVKRGKKIPESLKKKGNLPMTAAALKRMSVEASKKAMLQNSSLVAGVTAKNDTNKTQTSVIVPRAQSKIKNTGAIYDSDEVSLHSDFRLKSDRDNNSISSDRSLVSRASNGSRGSAFVINQRRPNSESNSLVSKSKDQDDVNDDDYDESDDEGSEISDKIKLFNLLGEDHHYVHDDSHPDTISSLLLMSEKEEIKILKREAGIESSSEDEDDD